MPNEMKMYNVPQLGMPLGQYSHVTRVKATEFIFIAGLVGTDENGKLAGAQDFMAQVEKTFDNIRVALASAGATWANVVQFTTYLVHSQDIPKLMEFRQREFPRMFPSKIYPPNTLLMVDRLVQEPLLVEVQTVAAI